MVSHQVSIEHLEGWGRTGSGNSYVLKPDILNSLLEAIKSHHNFKKLGRGAGRSYGDACLNSNSRIISSIRLDHVHDFDVEKGTLIAESGLRLNDLLSFIVPHGWFLPVIPGTLFPTIGGSFAADIHGKNHHFAGAFSKHVEWIEIVTADGSIVRCSDKENSRLFKATAGGMGLTGFIYRMKIRLIQIDSAYIYTRKISCNSLPEIMQTLREYDKQYPYTVAWLDCIASGSESGRGTVILCRHADRGELPLCKQYQPFRIQNGKRVEVPFGLPISPVNRLTIRQFNRLFYQKDHGRFSNEGYLSYDKAFCPLDGILNWNRIYGKKGFVQYQFVIPEETGESFIRRCISTLRRQGYYPSLCVLKQFGEGSGMLSFPIKGWTLALDIPFSNGLVETLNDLDDELMESGGRIYLAKDMCLKPENFRRMYPEFEDWKAIKDKYDPKNDFSSDMARRLLIS